MFLRYIFRPAGVFAFDNFANGIVILHVLEHVPVLTSAITELHRVLRTDGWLLAEVPCSRGDTKTMFCGDTDEERLEKCGQFDHQWVYNCDDFRGRFEEKGKFECQWVTNELLMPNLPQAVFDSYGMQNLQLLCRPKGT